MMMGTDMHVAIEVRRKEYNYVAKEATMEWSFVRKWTVDRRYDLFGCFGDIRTSWSNSINPPYARDMSWELEHEQKEYCYGFYEIKPDMLTSKVIGWSPAKEEWEEMEGFDRPIIDREWFFDGYLYLGDDVYKKDELNYAIYKMMLKRYGKKNVRLIVYFDS